MSPKTQTPKSQDAQRATFRDIAGEIALVSQTLKLGLVSAAPVVKHFYIESHTSGTVMIPRRSNRVLVLQDWTSTGQPLTEAVSEAPTVAEAVRVLHARSGLTWDELAALFATSRRALNHWVNGGRMSARNAARLEELTRELAIIGSSGGAIARDALMAPDETGVSRYSQLLSEIRPTLPAPIPLSARFGAIRASRDKTGRLVDVEQLD